MFHQLSWQTFLFFLNVCVCPVSNMVIIVTHNLIYIRREDFGNIFILHCHCTMMEDIQG